MPAPHARPHYKLDSHAWYIPPIGALQINALQIRGQQISLLQFSVPFLWLPPSFPIKQIHSVGIRPAMYLSPTESNHQVDSATVRHVKVAEPMHDQQ
ncbi:MAG: hypothetical protein CMM07_29075 [Rhodopirellula sp.]|nr:hypothetical protein [Rhodopirellula sp.]